jgi:hypothetical protein
MSIYYYGKLVGVYNPKQKEDNTGGEPVLVGDIIKSRDDYQKFTQPKTKFVIRHYQDA